MEEPAALARSRARRAPLRAQLARVLRALLGAPAALAAQLARALTRRRRQHTRPMPTGDRSGAAIMSATSPSESASDAAEHPDVPAIERITADPDLDEMQCATAFARLQCGCSAKVWDLCAARVISPDLFARLARSWLAPRGAVHRLAIVLRYDCWAVLHDVAARRLRALADRDVEVAILYEQQMSGVEHWCVGGPIVHDQLGAVLVWLRQQSRSSRPSSPSWRAVLAATADLIRRFADHDQVADLLIELAAIARKLGGDLAVKNAAEYAEAALRAAGDTPCSTRCEALRALALVRLRTGETGAALILLEAAITTAAMIEDRDQEARAQTEIGVHVLEAGHPDRAEVRFRRALRLLPANHEQCASLHHRIARALCAQGDRDAEAEQHVQAALWLRRDADSHLAALDRSLLAAIRKRLQASRSGGAASRTPTDLSPLSQTGHDDSL